MEHRIYNHQSRRAALGPYLQLKIIHSNGGLKPGTARSADKNFNPLSYRGSYSIIARKRSHSVSLRGGNYHITFFEQSADNCYVLIFNDIHIIMDIIDTINHFYDVIILIITGNIYILCKWCFKLLFMTGASLK